MQSEEPRQVPASVLIQAGVENKPTALQPELTMSEEEKVTLPSRALFLVGLLVFPIITGIISSSLIFLADNSDLIYESYEATPKPSITIQDEIYHVYEFNLENGFNQHYPPDCESGCWEIIVVVNNRTREIDGLIWGNRDGPSYNSFEKFTENGNVWHKMQVIDCHEADQEDMNCLILINIKPDENAVNVAIKHSGAPIYLDYWADDMATERGQYLFFFGIAIWPISIIGGIIWGLKTGRKPLAYGILSAGLVVVWPWLLLISEWN